MLEARALPPDRQGVPELPRRDPLRGLPVVEIDPRVAEGPRVGDLPVISMGGDPASPSVARHDAGPAPAATAAPDGVPGSHEVPPPTPSPAQSSASDPVERASAWLAVNSAAALGAVIVSTPAVKPTLTPSELASA